MAQKVKVQCCYIMADMLNLKTWGDGGAGSVVFRMAIRAPDGANKSMGLRPEFAVIVYISALRHIHLCQNK